METHVLKKLLATLALSLASVSSFAAGPVIGATYDFDRANGDGYRGTHEAKVSIAQPTSLGTFDAGLLGARYRGVRTTDDANGFELGYSNGLAVGRVGLTGRLGYGRMNQIDANGGGFTGNTNYWSGAVEASTPVVGSLNAFAGYRHRNGFGSALQAQNRYTLGVDYAVNKSVALRAGYAHTRQGTLVYNGLTTAATYNF